MVKLREFLITEYIESKVLERINKKIYKFAGLEHKFKPFIDETIKMEIEPMPSGEQDRVDKGPGSNQPKDKGTWMIVRE